MTQAIYGNLVSWQNALLWQALPSVTLALFMEKANAWAVLFGLLSGLSMMGGMFGKAAPFLPSLLHLRPPSPPLPLRPQTSKSLSLSFLLRSDHYDRTEFFGTQLASDDPKTFYLQVGGTSLLAGIFSTCSSRGCSPWSLELAKHRISYAMATPS
jgi:hypothetical protein